MSERVTLVSQRIVVSCDDHDWRQSSQICKERADGRVIHQDTLQVFGPLTPSRVWTITVTVAALLNNTYAFAGQLISGPA